MSAPPPEQNQAGSSTRYYVEQRSMNSTDRHGSSNFEHIQTYYHEDDYDPRGRSRTGSSGDMQGWGHADRGYYDGYYRDPYRRSYYSEDHYQTQSSHGWYGDYGGSYEDSNVYNANLTYQPGEIQHSGYDTGYRRNRRRGRISGTFKNQRSEEAWPEPPPRAPSPAYLAASLEPSRPSDIPLRKLLILDLNGTLLYRSTPPFVPRKPRGYPPPTDPEKIADNPTPDPPTLNFQKRIVYPRPYLPSFREYLFHESTESWLDVMIWSSAQPHSVDSMLAHCFPNAVNEDSSSNVEEESGDTNGQVAQQPKTRRRFIAVWARDTLGLSKFAYSHKTQTTKDLRKPWSQLNPSNLAAPSAETSPSASTPVPESEFHHSAKTTLLLDDSPLKAHLQPWNHVCLQEYDVVARKADVEMLETLTQIAASTTTQSDGETTSIPQRKPSSEKTELSTDTSSDSVSAAFDCTLLAVIGILEAAKDQSNIAAWIRSGGLWQGGALPSIKRDIVALQSGEVENQSAEILDKSTADPSKPTNAKRSLEADVYDATSHISKRVKLNRDPRDSTNVPSDSISPHKEIISSVHDVPTSEKSGGPNSNETGIKNEEPSPFWFTDKTSFVYWVSKGRDTLARLGIPEEHGVFIGEG